MIVLSLCVCWKEMSMVFLQGSCANSCAEVNSWRCLMILLFGAGGEAKGNKPKPVVEREHVDLISKIRSQSRPKKLDVALPSYIPIQHKRKPRSLVLSPAIDHLCATRYIFFPFFWFQYCRIRCISSGVSQ